MFGAGITALVLCIIDHIIQPSLRIVGTFVFRLLGWSIFVAFLAVPVPVTILVPMLPVLVSVLSVFTVAILVSVLAVFVPMPVFVSISVLVSVLPVLVSF